MLHYRLFSNKDTLSILCVHVKVDECKRYIPTSGGKSNNLGSSRTCGAQAVLGNVSPPEL